ncbi:MAG: hypothetical protein FWD92_04630 [Methanomassiliicoccaceae archaeon]|nr:hypothetical protein [Methanomassiliicoccaceae archaeon]
MASEEWKRIVDRVLDPAVKVVSFDIFDTLLVRPTVHPTDMFKLVGRKTQYVGAQFLQMRRLAETEARKRRPFGYDDVTLDEIYDTFSDIYCVSREEAERIKETELATEFKYLRPRKALKELYLNAIKAQKEVILASDMYLPMEFIESVLRKNGYDGHSKIYLSSELKLTKGNGRLFKKIVEDYFEKGIAPSEIVHLGDNFRADVESSKKEGLQAYHTPNPINILQSKRRLKAMSSIHRNIDDTFLIGYLANVLFDDPYTSFSTSSTIDGKLENLGILLSPMLLSFIKWMMEDSISSGVDKLLLVYRDGYLPEKIINEMRTYYPDAPNTDIIYLTRNVRYPFNSRYKSGIYRGMENMPPSQNMTVEEFIRYRLLAESEEEIKEIFKTFFKAGYMSIGDMIGPPERYYSLLGCLEHYFIKNSQKRIQTTLEYCNTKIGASENVAIFDVGYTGGVSRFIRNEVGMKNIGYQILSVPLSDIERNANDIRNFINYGFETRNDTIILNQIIENIISKQEPSVLEIVKNGDSFDYICENEYISDDNITQIQETIFNFCSDFIDMFKEDITALDISKYVVWDAFIRLLLNPDEKDLASISKLRFRDSDIIKFDSDPFVAWYLRHKNEKSANSTQDLKKIAIKILKTLRVYDQTQSLLKTLRQKMSPPQKTSTFLEEVEASIEGSLMRAQSCNNLKNNTLFVGEFTQFDKGVCNYISNLQNMFDDEGIVVISGSALSEERSSSKTRTPVLNVPPVLRMGEYPLKLNIQVTEDMKKMLSQNKQLQHAAENLRCRYINAGKGYPEALAYWIHSYFFELLHIVKPKKIVLWNKFCPLHGIINEIAVKEGIPVIYMEFGVLPGTFSLDTNGHTGESWPAVRYEDFMKLSVTDEEADNAGCVSEFIKNSRTNRYGQPENAELKRITSKLIPGRPTILYTGEFDLESGLFPYTERAKEFYSPIFGSSDDAASFLSKLSKKNKWNFIYRPHPLTNVTTNPLKANETIITEADINDLIDVADVTVTILSQTGYTSSIKNKATVMLGYTQLKNKGCTYEAFTENEIETAIKNAIQYGQTEEMKENFRKHVAQLLKYYLFDDLTKREKRYGRSIDEALETITGNRTSDLTKQSHKNNPGEFE